MLEGLERMVGAEVREVAKLAGLPESTPEDAVIHQALAWLAYVVGQNDFRHESIERGVLEWLATRWGIEFKDSADLAGKSGKYFLADRGVDQRRQHGLDIAGDKVGDVGAPGVDRGGNGLGGGRLQFCPQRRKLGGVPALQRLQIEFMPAVQFGAGHGVALRPGLRANCLDIDFRLRRRLRGAVLAAVEMDGPDARKLEIGQEPGETGRHDRLRLASVAGNSRFNFIPFEKRRRGRCAPSPLSRARRT